LLRAAQSSLANVWAHAKARTAVVTLSFLDAEVTMDVFDDGVGFDPATVLPAAAARGDGHGVGIQGLRERVSALGGSLDVESAPGEGTVVAIRLPLTERSAPDA
jgi:signal transduction histidine kinase